MGTKESNETFLKAYIAQRDELEKKGCNDEELNDKIRHYQKLVREEQSK